MNIIKIIPVAATTLLCATSIMLAAGCDGDNSKDAWRHAETQTGRPSQSSLSPDEDLIYAVKGIKNGAALLVGMINPLIGVMVAAADYKESPSDLPRINEALSRGANIDYMDSSGWTPLAYAAYYGYPNIAAHLLRQNANRYLAVSAGSWTGYTPLEIAKYYHKQYQIRRQNCSQDMIEFYDNKIVRYQELVNLLS